MGHDACASQYRTFQTHPSGSTLLSNQGRRTEEYHQHQQYLRSARKCVIFQLDPDIRGEVLAESDLVVR